MVNLTEILQDIFRTNQLTSEIIASVIIFSLTVLIGGFAYYLFGRYFSTWAKQTKTTLGNEILRNIKPAVIALIILAGFYYALGSTTFMAAYSEQLSALFTVLEIILIAFAIAQATTVLAAWYVSRHTENHTVKNNHIPPEETCPTFCLHHSPLSYLSCIPRRPIWSSCWIRRRSRSHSVCSTEHPERCY
jgi:glucan phosphoethanolaminetransferase (alkaline phosphatase superfamily)